VNKKEVAMSIRLSSALAVAIAINFWLPSLSAAVEFTIVGPRATGMGGTGVAATTDALATYWNPAGLAMEQSVDIQVQGGVHAIDRLGVRETLDDINNISQTDISGANQARLQGFLDRLNAPGASVSGSGSAGLYFKGYRDDHAFGFNVSDVATGGVTVPTPLTISVGTTLNVNGQLALRGLEARQAAFSYAHAFFDKTLAFGATAKIIQGAAYSGRASVFGTEGGLGFTSDIGKATISTTFSLDAGAVYKPTSWLRLGVVGKDLTQPTFDAPGGEEFKLLPQVRAGVAVNPYSSLTLTADADITSNKTLLPGVKSRVIGVGAEQTLFDVLALRVGALKNVEDAKSVVMPTAGLGLKIFALRLDLGGGYDFQARQAMASGALGLTF
jgi:hypothetical protein